MVSVQDGLNTFFLLYSGALVFIMQAGFAMLCAGSVRQKNVKNIMLKNLLDACFGALGFWCVGFSFAYSDGNTFIGTTNFFINDFSTGPDLILWFYQFAFAATAATIVAGTVAERCKMQAYMCYSFFLTGFVYPVVVRSVWSGYGFLSAFADDKFRGVGAIDFAGSGVVHMTGGATALVAACILGPRMGRFYDEDGNSLESPTVFPAHSVSLQVLGTFLLWFGWYGFNPGSTLLIDNSDSASVSALCAVTTTMAAASGCVTAMLADTFLEVRRTGEVSYDLTRAMNGVLAGLVGVTAGCAVVKPWAAVVIGIVAGLVYVGFSSFLISLKIDDAVDAIPVHLASGMWGILAVGLFAEESAMASAGYNSERVGLFYSWTNGSSDANLLLCQFLCVLWVLGWVLFVMTPFFLVLNALGMFRVDALEEEVGLDISHHRGGAYDLSAPKKEDIEELMEVRASRHGKVEVPKEVADDHSTDGL
jgi:Amt family ammonium transporter